MTAASSGPAVRQPLVATQSPQLARWARQGLGRQVWFDSTTVGGPLTELGPVAQLSVLLEGSGVDLCQVEDVVVEGSGGRLALLGADPAAAGGMGGRHVR